MEGEADPCGTAVLAYRAPSSSSPLQGAARWNPTCDVAAIVYEYHISLAPKSQAVCYDICMNAETLKKRKRKRNRLAVAKYRQTEKGKTANRRIRARYKQQSRLEIERIKSTTPCADCGRFFPPECVDFDHVRGEKVSAVARMLSQRSTQALLNEIAKCDVVCACCHRTRTKARKDAAYQERRQL